VGRLSLLPVSQRLDASSLPSAVLRLIRSILKTEAFVRSLLELAFAKVIDRYVMTASLHAKFMPELIDLLGVGDTASVVSLCDAILSWKERTLVPVDVQQLRLYRADLAARSSVKCPVERFSVPWRCSSVPWRCSAASPTSVCSATKRCRSKGSGFCSPRSRSTGQSFL
jgi:hypothetical protein